MNIITLFEVSLALQRSDTNVAIMLEECILVKLIWKCIHKLRRIYRKYMFDKMIVTRKMVLLSVEAY